MNDYAGAFGRMLGTLGILVLGLFVVLRAFTAWRRRGPRPRRGAALELIESLRLDARRSIHVVRAGRRILVLGAADGALVDLSDPLARDPDLEGLAAGARPLAGPEPMP